MPASMVLVVLHFFFFFFFFFSTTMVIVESQKQTYIVYMDATQKPNIHPTHADWYAAHLESLSIDPTQHLLYAYTTALQGFAAVLHPDHLPRLRSHPSVVRIHLDPLLHLHTTRSPRFLGLFDPSTASAAQAVGNADDVIVGVLDTGVWPESKSFSDVGIVKPPPSRWRGECQAGVDFTPSLCNNKLIGARSFSRGHHAAASSSSSLAVAAEAARDKTKEYVSPRDRDGHGTHTASTAAGSPVANASLLGYASGTARGMATGARVAVYKVCWSAGCFGSDILAGMDRAISDRVDVLSLSLGGGAAPYFHDTIAVGAFAAMTRGIFVACSAGNSGPKIGSLANTAPWIATVGAGTLDRDFPAYITLGNGVKYTGVSLYSGRGMGRKMAPLVYFGTGVKEGRAKVTGGTNSSSLCLPGTLDPALVKGKVVFCDRGVNARVEKGAVVKAAGGVGMILANMAANGEELVADSHLLPALAVGTKVGNAIRDYVRSDRKPMAVIRFGGTVLNVRPSPVVAAFSSRGPNGVTPQILKPDVIGPGVNILAAWSGSSGPTGLTVDKRRSDFNIMSGTSMSCPHISGLAALLKAEHPDWSPAAIKSALMTTAYNVDNTGSPLRDAAHGGSVANPYAYGSGHVDPQKALSPGLVYDAGVEDYISFLCSLKYSMKNIQTVTNRSNVSCKHRSRNPGNLNYPSFAVVFGKKWRRGVKYVRELTNVGVAKAVYKVKIERPHDIKVKVKPKRLVFKEVGQKLKFAVKFKPKKAGKPFESGFGWITWSNRQHHVRSPIAYRWNFV